MLAGVVWSKRFFFLKKGGAYQADENDTYRALSDLLLCLFDDLNEANALFECLSIFTLTANEHRLQKYVHNPKRLQT